MKPWLCLLLGLLSLAAPAHATVRHVPAQYSTIQAAIDAAVAGDTVLVGPGAYAESLTLPHNDLTLLSSAGATNTNVFQITITNPFLETASTVIDGFTFVNGLGAAMAGSSGAIRVRNCDFGPFAGVAMGGNPSPHELIVDVRNCEVTGAQGISLTHEYAACTVASCTLHSTGGIQVHGYPANVSNCVLEQGSVAAFSEGYGASVDNCTLQGGSIEMNTDAFGNASGNHLTGGRIYVHVPSGMEQSASISGNVLIDASIVVGGPGSEYNGKPESGRASPARSRSFETSITGNQISGGSISVASTWGVDVSGNTISNSGGAIQASAAVLALSQNTIRDCADGISASAFIWSFITGNDVRGCTGTGIIASEYDSVVVEQNLIVACGTGIEFSAGRCRGNTIVDCANTGLFVREAYLNMTPREISRMILVQNGRGIVAQVPLDPAIFACNDVWSNPNGNWIGIPDLTGQSGNISVDPLFCDPEHGIYTLADASPCLPGNHPQGFACGTIGAFGRGCSVPAAIFDGVLSDTGSAGTIRSIEPNPATGPVRVRLARGDARVRLGVYTVTGARIRLLIEASGERGVQTVEWDLRDERGARVLPGVYLIKTLGGGSNAGRKLVVIR